LELFFFVDYAFFIFISVLMVFLSLILLAHWMWSRYLIYDPILGNYSLGAGWLKSFGALDWAGGCAVHIAPGVSSMIVCRLA
jgi:ammonia channel protein AmtB